MSKDTMKCALCGEPMPVGEEMFTIHGYSGPCPSPPLAAPVSREAQLEAENDTLKREVALWEQHEAARRAETDALRQERDALLHYRERAWRAETRADEKWALRRELEAILGVKSGAAGDAQFAAGVTALKALVAERDALQSALKQSKALECMTCQAEAERVARIEADLALARAVLESVDESPAWVGDTVLLRAKAEPWRKWQRWRAQR